MDPGGQCLEEEVAAEVNSGDKTFSDFAKVIHANAYGTTNPGYFWDLTSVLGNINARENCPK
jgi:hypothetical protein